MMNGFGLDLAGFSNPRGTVLAAIQAEKNEAKVILLGELPFSRRLGDGSFADRINCETVTLKRLLEIGAFAVDVPIDLQGLPLEQVIEPWQLTKRPVDEALDGLPPLACWLGACVARFAAIIPCDLKEKERGVRLFETYPAAYLRERFGENDPDVGHYKLARREKAEIASAARRRLCKGLKIECVRPELSHDDLDAIICALAAVATPDEIVAEDECSRRKAQPIPAGYGILNKKNQFEEIRVSRMPFGEWIGNNQHCP